jgi:acyl-CoA synthetase (AMP-forming)/AMP-acid ligase II
MKAAAADALWMPEAAPVHHDAPAMLLPTSGTTGPSKLVVWTFRTLASFTASASSRGVGADDTLLLSAPMMHASGSAAYARGLLTGAVMVLLSRFEAGGPRRYCRASLHWLLGSTVYIPFARRQRARPRDVSSLRLLHHRW